MTTLNEARTALHQLSLQFPVPSTYADKLAVLLDYFDTQVPLNIEVRNLMQRITVLEATLNKVREELPTANFVFASGASKDVLPPDPDNRRYIVLGGRPIDCTAWMGTGAGACRCAACKVVSHA